jgi:hypothetical protein
MANPDFNIWYKSFDKSFLYINERSNIKDEWLDYDEILKSKYKNTILKPINKYMEKLSIPPKLISIKNNVVTLCQENFAEIFLLQKKDSSSLRAIEKIHMRQFYLSNENLSDDGDCFKPTFRWAMPWFIDSDDIDIQIINIKESPFYFYNTSFISKQNKNKRVDPKMLFFKFKNVGSHMVDDEYARIKRNQQAYFIQFSCNDIMIRKIEEFYGKG